MTKAEIKNVSSYMPETIYQVALTKCYQIINEAVANMHPESSKDPQMLQIWLKIFSDSMRKTYEEYADSLLLVPRISEYRTQQSLYEWKACVVGKAKDWSRLADDAKLVAQASVSACKKQERYATSAVKYDLRIKKLPVSAIDQVMENVKKGIDDFAVQAVISERAARLLK